MAAGLCHTQLCTRDFVFPIGEDKETTEVKDMNYREKGPESVLD